MTKGLIRWFWVVIVVVTAAAAVGAHAARAATLSFSPQSGTYFAGRSFSVSVLVSSPDQGMNAAQGEISFPANDLEVLSLSESNSVMSIWVQNPTFSNQDGTIDFGGVAVSPGFQGTNGNVITIRFEAKNSGNAPLSFVSGSVLANDGKGTNILTSMGAADFTITPLASTLASADLSSNKGNAPAAVIINTTPSVVPGQWYNLDQITFNWSVPADAEGVDYTISNNADLQLPDVNQGMVSQASYNLSQFSDGVWYFFVSFNSGSAWSPPAVVRLMLDRSPPAPFIISRIDTNQTDPRPLFAWAANDVTSGIDHYEVKIGDGDWFDSSVIQNGSSSYLLPLQSPAIWRTLTVRAFDKAGNYADATTNFTVIGPAVGCTAGNFSCAVSSFFAQWGALISGIFVCLVLILYGFLYYLLRWRKQSRRELQKFKDELQQDLKRVEESVIRAAAATSGADPRQSSFLEEKQSLENELHHITEDVKEELKRLQDKKIL